jgi:peptidoglycan/LPS O-acetylase OafA/YrhL
MKWVASWILVHSDPEFRDWRFLGVALLGYLLTWALAQLSWRYIENPLIRRGHDLTSQNKFLSAADAQAGGPKIATSVAS